MFDSFRKHTYPIGIDIGDEGLKVVQLSMKQKAIALVSADRREQPQDIKKDSGPWQRWAVESLCELTGNGRFCGKEVVAMMPARDVFIDNVRIAATDNANMEEMILARIKQKLPFEAEQSLIRHIPTENDNVIVIATERAKVDRHLAIYESANLQIKSLSVWPIALVNIYTGFFGRRASDIETIVMLLDIESNYTNVAICRHSKLLFARCIPIGAKDIESENMLDRLIYELTACRKHFDFMYKKIPIERMLFLSGKSVDSKLCAEIAKKLETPAQIGDCLAVVEPAGSHGFGIDEKENQYSWAAAFGLSLS